MVENPPFPIILGFSTLESLGACIDMGRQCVRIYRKGKEAELPLLYEKRVGFEEESGTDSEDFTSGTGDDEWSSTSSEEDLVVCLRSDLPVAQEEEDKREGENDEGSITEPVSIVLSKNQLRHDARQNCGPGENRVSSDAFESLVADPRTPGDVKYPREHAKTKFKGPGGDDHSRYDPSKRVQGTVNMAGDGAQLAYKATGVRSRTPLEPPRK